MAASETADGATAMDAASSDELWSDPISPKPQSQPHSNAEVTLDMKFWYACQDSRVPIASPTVGSIRHRMRVFLAESAQACDVSVVDENGLEWHFPNCLAVAYSTKMAKILQDKKERPVRLTVDDPLLNPLILDTAVRHWFRGDYDFDVAEHNDDDIIINLRHACTSGKDGRIPSKQTFSIPKDCGLVMADMMVYTGAKKLGDETLADHAFSKFKVALSQSQSVMVLINLVKAAFGPDYHEFDTDYKMRHLIANWAHVWDKVWTLQGNAQYFGLWREMPEFGRMMKELEYQALVKLQEKHM